VIKTLAMAGTFLAVALPAASQEVSQQAAALLDVIIANNCGMTKEEAAATLPGLGFPRQEYRVLMKELKDTGMVVLSGGSATVAEGLCPAPAPSQVFTVPYQEQYIAILRHNGCQLQTGEAGSLFPKYGMDANLAAELEEGLVDSGIAQITDGALHIGPEYCVPDEAFPSLPLLDLNYEEQHLIEGLEMFNCSLVLSEIDLTYPQDGQSPEAARAAVESLLASGAARAVSGGDRVWISPDICKPWSERGH
jgi:hypothetical protein